ncbi:MAG: DNA-formamidopyrimidine glycosylase [Bacteroidota bacterium]
MPELPEVEWYRRYVEGTALHQRITAVQVRDAKPLQQSEEEFQQTLVNHAFVDTERVGKYFFLKLDTGSWMLMHFGMTGEPVYYRDSEDEPRFVRVEFLLENGFKLAFNDARKFGKLELVPDLPAFLKAKKLAEDALKVTKEDFVARLGKKKKAVKSALLDQNLAAGIGNWIADEMTYLAKIHPEVKAHTLTQEQLGALHDALQEVLEVALEYESDYDNFPDKYLTKYRWAEDKEVQGQCPCGKTELERIVVGGRGTYFCTLCQKAE